MEKSWPDGDDRPAAAHPGERHGLTICDGRITDVWVMSDDADLMRQLAQLPTSV
jgi:hypothetical protein